MAKTSQKSQQIDPDEVAPPESYDANAEEARPGESLDDYMARRDDEESQWQGKQGGQGPSRHDANETRRPFKVTESWDCHLGDL